MNILLIDTSGRTCTVAVANEEKVLCERFTDNGLTHSETLMPMIGQVMEEASLDMGSVSVIGITNGPGSFTGLRIGMSTAKALSYAANSHIAEISTLDAIRENAGDSDKIIIAAIDALHERVYAAAYNGLEMEKGIYELSFVLEKAGETGKEVLFVGDGAEKYREIILSFSPLFETAGPEAMYPNAGGLYSCTRRCIEEGKFEDCYTTSISYFMASQAERNYHG